MTNAELIQKMESVLEEECRQYEQMLEISREQIRLLEEDETDVDRLAHLMEKKVLLVEKIKHLEAENVSIKETWAKMHSNFPQKEKQNIAALKQRYLDTVENLAQQEGQIALGIQGQENLISQRLQSIRRGKEVNQAYFKQEGGPPKFFDKKK